LELTDKCNIRCKHCYGDYGIERINSIPKEKLQYIFESMVDAGVLLVELTGGDPSVYPYTSEAIELAFKSGIQTVMLLTNGIKLSSNLVNTIEKYKERIFVQIDLHSLNEEYYDWFTGSKGNLEKVKENIILLTSKNVQVRVCSILTPKSYHEVTDIANWAYNHGAKLYAASFVIELGRATKKVFNDDLIFKDVEDLKKYFELYSELIKKYPNFIKLKIEEEQQNCKALTSSCSIKSNGNIKLCTMDTGEYFNLNLGNVLKNSIKEIYDSNIDFLNRFIELRLPNRESETCINCENIWFCENCFLRGFLMSQNMNGKCSWLNESVPNLVKERFNRKEELAS
jgi:radical SAM protein with 4Fe4S-binding SPASM domain